MRINDLWSLRLWRIKLKAGLWLMAITRNLVVLNVTGSATLPVDYNSPTMLNICKRYMHENHDNRCLKAFMAALSKKTNESLPRLDSSVPLMHTGTTVAFLTPVIYWFIKVHDFYWQMEGVGGCLQLLNVLLYFLQQKQTLPCIVFWYFYILYILADNTKTLHAGYRATFWLVQIVHVQTIAGIKVRLVIIYNKSLKFTPSGECRIYSTHK